MIRALNVMQWTLYSLLYWPLLAVFREGSTALSASYLGLVLMLGVVVAFRQLRIRRRRVILEDGLVSIHSCAITWAAVAIAPVVAADDGRRPYFHYTERLAALARHIEVQRLPALVGRYLVNGDPLFDPRTTLCEPALNRRGSARRRTTSAPPRSGERRAQTRMGRRESDVLH